MTGLFSSMERAIGKSEAVLTNESPVSELEKQKLGECTLSDYFLTYLWTWMECFSAILLFDAFSARKRNRVVHWITVTAVAFLDATLLNFAATTMPNYSKIVIAFALYFFMHRLLYTSNGMFSFYISIVFYATICCVDNCWYTILLLMSKPRTV